MLIYIIRHGETEWNTKKLLQGATDIPLNENGMEVAKLTSEALKDVPFDLIFTSPLQRAKKTAQIICADREIPIIEEPRLREISFGPYEGCCCSRKGYNIPDPEFLRFFDDPAQYIPPEGGESIPDLIRRTKEFLQELIHTKEYQDKTILLSAHGAVVKGLLFGTSGEELKDFWKGGVHRNCAVSVLEAADEKIRLLQENVIYYDEKRSTNYFE